MRSTARAGVVGLTGATVLGLAGAVAQQIDEQSYATVAAWHHPAGWVLVFVVGLALVVAAVGASLAGRGGWAQVALLVVWLGPVVAGWESGPAWVRSCALALGPLSPLVVTAAARPLGRPLPRRLWVVAGALCGGSALLVLLAYEPFRDPDCAADCSANPFALTHVSSALAFALGVAALVGALLAVVLVHRAALDQDDLRWLVGLAVGATAAVTTPGLYWTGLATSLPWVVAVAVGVGSLTVLQLEDASTRLGRRRRLASLVTLLTDTPEPEDLAAALSDALGDRVEVSYPDPAGQGYVDTAGHSIQRPGGDRLDVTSRGVVVAVLTGPGVRTALGDRSMLDVDPALALLVENASVVAGLRAQVSRVRSARADVVSATDAARAALEHDLHDGAQQLVLALGIDLRLLADSCPPGGPSEHRARAARDELVAALGELRAVAHGLHPAALGQGGLEAAIDQLTEQTGVQVTVDGPTDLSSGALMAAYRLIETAAEQVADRGRPVLFVTVSARAEEWELALDDGTDDPLVVGDVADRVAAVGGTMLGGPPLTATLPRPVPTP